MAVLEDSKACLVNAQVGSGKTTVLISKILYLHYEKQIPYKDMVVLTFTNKAAEEIKERLRKQEENLSVEELQGFGTFHRVALHLLKEQLPIEQFGYTREFLVMDPEEEVDLALSILQEEKLTIKYKNRLKKRLEQAFEREDLLEEDQRYQDDLSVLVKRLTEEKIRLNKMNFVDLLKISDQLLQKESSHWKPAWIIVDEVQDCDARQFALLNHLRGRDTKLFAVGDPNQVIYSWRGSTFDVFRRWKEEYQAKELSLPINYRSSTSILEAAKVFLQNGNDLVGIRETGNKIIVKNHYNAFQEADYLARKIKKLHASGIPYSDVAIFYRLQNQSEELEQVFEREEIPIEVSLKKTIKDIPVLNWFIRVLRFSINPQDLASGIAVLCDPNYGIGITEKGARKRIREYGGKKAETTLPLFAYLEKKEEPQKYKEPDILCQMLEFQEKYLQQANTNISKKNWIFGIQEYFHLNYYLHPTAATYQEDKEAIQSILALMEEFVDEQSLEPQQGLREFLNASTLYGKEIISRSIHSEKDSVKLMTLHASKGLEFSYVFIIGVNYGLIPLHCRDEEEEEEEKRLFFVGITRAKDQLELSYYTSSGQNRVAKGASFYLNMIPRKLVENETRKQEKVNLQDLKRQIMKNREIAFEKEKDSIQIAVSPEVKQKETQDTQSKRNVRHLKYGLGVVVKEDADMITVLFEDYGEKEFMKLFSELEELGTH